MYWNSHRSCQHTFIVGRYNKSDAWNNYIKNQATYNYNKYKKKQLIGWNEHYFQVNFSGYSSLFLCWDNKESWSTNHQSHLQFTCLVLPPMMLSSLIPDKNYNFLMNLNLDESEMDLVNNIKTYLNKYIDRKDVPAKPPFKLLDILAYYFIQSNDLEGKNHIN